MRFQAVSTRRSACQAIRGTHAVREWPLPPRSIPPHSLPLHRSVRIGTLMTLLGTTVSLHCQPLRPVSPLPARPECVFDDDLERSWLSRIVPLWCAEPFRL